MKKLIFILSFFTTVAHAQFFDLIPKDKHFFDNNLSANANHTHNGAKKITTINNLGGWFMRSGVVANGSFGMDSTGVSLIAPSITLSKGIGMNPRLWLDGATGTIFLTTSAGLVIIENLQTFANDAAATIGGLPQHALYKTSSGVLMIKL